ncbi:MAG: 16S rRNA (cytosine(1402)-N(4))-methyltransferase RsmH [Sphaerochaetaceae bacterium]|nr:16S rRNA (cytosine(1402)-N(4))-methyltransferase RsmH [Sphaerochaetaceae bacterium]
MQYVHCPVMKNEALEYLVPKRENPIMVDCTLGEGGHSEAFLQKYPNLKVIGLDRDDEIRAKAINRLSPFGDRFEAKATWFDEFWKNYEGPQVDIILFDLGISVFHYEESKRGFSFRKSEDLDMRLNRNKGFSAADVVNTYGEKELADLIYGYGEERYSRRIAKAICEYRKTKAIRKTDELADIIYSAVPGEYRHHRIHPATKTFQAIRIEVNGELGRIEPALDNAIDALVPGGRIGVITFHSLEDRPVKWFFRNHTDRVNILTRKPVIPTEEECRTNTPSRSAKFRVAEKRGVENE